jgi:hypothetical protein
VGKVHMVKLINVAALARFFVVGSSSKSMKNENASGKKTKHHMKPPKL